MQQFNETVSFENFCSKSMKIIIFKLCININSTYILDSYFVIFFLRQEFTSLMEALRGESSKSALNNGVLNGLMRSDSFGSSRASTPSPTMGKWVI